MRILFFGNPQNPRSLWLYEQFRHIGCDVHWGDPNATGGIAGLGIDFAWFDQEPIVSPSVAEMVSRLPKVPELHINKLVEPKLKQLTTQWNRAKVQGNKNLMRDLERQMECLRGY